MVSRLKQGVQNMYNYGSLQQVKNVLLVQRCIEARESLHLQIHQDELRRSAGGLDSRDSSSRVPGTKSQDSRDQESNHRESIGR